MAGAVAKCLRIPDPVKPSENHACSPLALCRVKIFGAAQKRMLHCNKERAIRCSHWMGRRAIQGRIDNDKFSI